LLRAGTGHLLAKFTTSTDIHPTIKAAALGLEFARRVGIEVPSAESRSVMGREVLVRARFDRTATGGRRIMLSGLTMLGLAEHEGHNATYPVLLDELVRRGTDLPAQSQRAESVYEIRLASQVCVAHWSTAIGPTARRKTRQTSGSRRMRWLGKQNALPTGR